MFGLTCSGAAAVSALKLDMDDLDIDEAMREIDQDGSGEIDKKEFKEWFAKGQDDQPTGEGVKPSKIGEIRGRTMINQSQIAALGGRLRHLPPSAALTGDASLGTLIAEYGLDVTPSHDNEMPFRVSDDYECGRYSVQAHCTPSVDAVEISLPVWCFKASAEELKLRADEAFASFDTDESGDIDASELMRLTRCLRVRLDEEGVSEAIVAMTGDEESEVVTKEQFALWYSSAASPSDPGGATAKLSAGEIAQKLHVRRIGARIGDGLAAFLNLSYGFCTLPGSGSRRGPPRLMGAMFTREIKVGTVIIKADGSLVGGK